MRKPVKEKPLANVLRLIRRDTEPSIIDRSKAWGSFKEFADSFNENQPRDDHGKWSSGGSGTGDPKKPQEVSRNQVRFSQQYAEKQRADERQKRYDAFSNAQTAWERGGRQGLPPDHRKFGLTALGAAAARLDRTRIVNNSGQAAVHPTSPAERSEPPTSPAERADSKQHANLSLLWNPPKRAKDAKPRGLRALARQIGDDKDQLGHGSYPRNSGPQPHQFPTFETNKKSIVGGRIKMHAEQQAEEWLKANGAVPRTATVTKDVTLPSGDILKNRTFRANVYDLPNGHTVEIQTEQASSNPAGPHGHRASIVLSAAHFQKHAAQ